MKKLMISAAACVAALTLLPDVTRAQQAPPAAQTEKQAVPTPVAPPDKPSAAPALKVEEKVSYAGAEGCIRISNENAELIIATQYGPRVLRYAPAGGKDTDNVFGIVPEVTVKTDIGQWFIRGGHRLWHAPEGKPRSYVPDNDPVKVVREGDTFRLIQPVEKQTGIEKEIDITLDPTGTHVTVLHKLTNRGYFAADMACWAMSVMGKGGMAIVPQEPYQSHDDALLPARPLVLWPYTNLTDPRWQVGQKYITLRQDPDQKESQKVGVLNRQGWAAYYRSGLLFFKRFPCDADKSYPDFNSNNEIYADGAILELETLGMLEKVQPGATITHREDWWLYKSVDIGNGEAGIAAALQPILTETARKQ
jgi:hypothetical protein